MPHDIARSRHVYRRALLQSGKTLTPSELRVAMIYEEHAGHAGPGAVFATTAVLVEWTGLSERAIATAREGLAEKGWLALVEPARGRRAARYALTIPEGVVVDVAPEEVESGAVRMIPGALVQHDGGPVHRAPKTPENVVPIRRPQRRPWENLQECPDDGSVLRKDGTCPVCHGKAAAF